MSTYWKENKTFCEIIMRRKLLRYFREKLQWGAMDWIHLAQDRDQWRALVDTVMNLRVP
jgi:hypothetical protein